eukprot:CAMPEP_0170747764 /NCGR_PEP_ID=MMETSP0437-20130122/9494_1 /TAXON_ID=0 /ORGANISM="Sexangularia sp." /LENGTH=467 /DNA_ID=CAMNT_0011086559 /DNA_START=84 /DNA_END=1487 /DNA_ORIENTATION=+
MSVEHEPDTTEAELSSALSGLSTQTSGKEETEEAKEAAARAQYEKTGLAEPKDIRLRVRDEQADPNSPLHSALSFEELQLEQSLLDGIYAMGYEKPSSIQGSALPLVLGTHGNAKRSNLIAQAQSGTGKTAAFTLSMLATVKEEPTVQAICVCPTRELARQNADRCTEMAKFTKLAPPCLVVKDAAIPPKIQAQIVIGTAGKLLDVIQRRALDPKTVKILVLDEADVMMDTQGQGEQTRKIRSKLPKTAQVLLFSATYSDRVRTFAEKVVPKPVATITLAREELSLDKIAQYYIKGTEEDGTDIRFDVLEDIYGYMAVGHSVIFTHRKDTALNLQKRMTDEGYAISLLTGDLDPKARDQVIDDFRTQKTRVLITTNVLARGIDIQHINLVINYDPPMHADGSADPETYLHRIGRSGRFGRSGIAINLYHNEASKAVLDQIADHFKKPMVAFDREKIPELAGMLRALN